MVQFLRFAGIRAALAFVTLCLVSFIVFSLMELVPGNCAERYLAFKNTQGVKITVEDIASEEKRLGLDKPYIQRWASWVGNVFFRGDFGDSCILRVRPLRPNAWNWKNWAPQPPKAHHRAAQWL